MKNESHEPPRVLFLISLSLGFLCALAWVLWDTPRQHETDGRKRSDGIAGIPRVATPSNLPARDPLEVTDEDRRLYSPRALARDPSLRDVDPEAAFRERILPRIEESQRFEQWGLGLGLDESSRPSPPRQARNEGKGRG
ncbi:MAG: hypothetical protein H6834_07120 [Planctomycetes bacterium]|nr:hypothetical protein [Planctomycetota bacterium]MCB9891558.1 hypothetical protein [Planctomycetota bacterium]